MAATGPRVGTCPCPNPLIHWGNDMRHKHLVAAAATAGLLAIGPLSGFASATTASGAGTATDTSTLLGVQLGTDGSLLGLRLLGQDGMATNDPAKGAAASTEALITAFVSLHFERCEGAR